MRLSQFSRLIRRPATRLSSSKSAIACASLSLAVFGLAGCSGMNGDDFDPNRSFIDPSELTYAKTITAMPVPILDTLGTGVEEPMQQFEGATEVQPEDLIAEPQDYRIGPNDLVQIAISDLVAPGQEQFLAKRVSETGRISLPLVGQVQAKGYTEAELEQVISARYRDENIIQSAQVTVTVIEARNRTFSVLGAVGATGEYQMFKGEFRLLDALVLARGVAGAGIGIDYIYIIRDTADEEEPPPPPPPGAGRPGGPDLAPRPPAPTPRDGDQGPATVPGAGMGAAETGQERYVIGPDGRPQLIGQPAAVQPPDRPPSRRDEEAGQPGPATEGFEFNDLREPSDIRIIRIPYGPLKQGELKYNIVIKPKDQLIVPEPTIGEYYMGGHVARVGVYSLTGRKITLKQAIVSAGMLDALGIPGRTQLIRRVEEDKEVFVRLDLGKIFAGQEPDLYLKPDDIITVGTTAAAPFLAALRGGFRITYGFGFLYDRNYAYDRDDRF